MSPSLAGRFLTTGPPGRSLYHSFVGGYYLSVMLASGVSGVRREGPEGEGLSLWWWRTDRLPAGRARCSLRPDHPLRKSPR